MTKNQIKLLRKVIRALRLYEEDESARPGDELVEVGVDLGKDRRTASSLVNAGILEYACHPCELRDRQTFVRFPTLKELDSQ